MLQTYLFFSKRTIRYITKSVPKIFLLLAKTKLEFLLSILIITYTYLIKQTELMFSYRDEKRCTILVQKEKNKVIQTLLQTFILFSFFNFLK